MNAQNQGFLQRLEGIDQLIERGMKDWKIPGCAISVVNDGELVYSKGYGFRDPENNLEMTPDTYYRMASNTKAFVAMCLAILVDEGKLDWDKPVRDYIPYFRLKDGYATEHVTPRDLLCHRTGLPAHDWALHHLKTRKEMVEHLQYLEPSYPIRTKLQYNNLMYMTAGHLVDCITGQSWEAFAQERIFDPLGMEQTTFKYYRTRMSGNHAECYYHKGDELRMFKSDRQDVDPDSIYPRSPAGGINSTANDMAKWMLMLLNKGEFKGKRIVSEKAFSEFFSPQMIDNWNQPYTELGETSCGLGWFNWAYKGHKIAIHGGFFGSQVFLLPREKLGVTVMPTLNETGFHDVVLFNAVDRLMGYEPIDWNARKLKEWEEAARNRKPEPAPKPGTSPLHALEEYCGEFTHPGYGKLVFKLKEGKLVLADDENADKTYPVRHFHYDTFEVLEQNGEVEFRITFQTDAMGNVCGLASPFEPAVKEIVYTRGA
jgi:CubicO group peptidase (beta-lactamase class C family)